MCQRKTKQMREFEPILKANGYREIRSNGSHFIYKADCIHRNAYRRLPEIDGGLGLCPNLKGE